jgi:hypothetical protein
MVHAIITRTRRNLWREMAASSLERRRPTYDSRGLLRKARVPLTMTSRLPPLPWDWIASGAPSANGQFHAYLVDATGRKIAAIWGKGNEKEAIADHILRCVNGADGEGTPSKGE